MNTLSDFRAFLETIPREFLVAMADTAEREDRIEALEGENVRLRAVGESQARELWRLRQHRCAQDLAREFLASFDND